jgi:hypothetical protein
MGIMAAVKKGFGVASKGMGLVAILFVFNLVSNLAAIPFAQVPAATGTTPPPISPAAIIFSVIFILLGIFFQGASLGLVRDALKEGKMKLASFASYGLKYYLKLFLLGLAIILVVAVIALIVGLMVAVTGPLNNPVVTAIAVTIAVAIGIAALLMLFVPMILSPYALICDNIGVVESIKKSLRVGKTPFSRVFVLILIMLVLVLISLGAGLVAGFIVGLISAAVPTQVGQVIMSIATSAINGYFGVVVTAAFMAYYLAISGAVKGTEKVF